MNTKEQARKAVELHGAICARAEREIHGWNRRDRLSAMIDLESLPNLDLEGLLNAGLMDFAHDMCGIRRHMDRSSFPGKLTDCFVPRFMR